MAYSTCELGDCSVLEAELWGIFHCVTIAWTRDLCQFVVYSDSQIVVGLLVNGCHCPHPCAPLVESIRRVHKDSGSIRWIHCLWEASQVANQLAKHNLSILTMGCEFLM